MAKQQSKVTTPPVDGDDSAPTVAQRTAATLVRRKEELRSKRLSEMREQIDDGTLQIRQMTVAERLAASKVARSIGERNQARQRRPRSPR